MGAASNARDDLLALIGVEDVTPYIGTPVLTRILNDINATRQEMYSLGPDFWSKDDAGDALRAPVSLSDLTLANGSRTVTGSLASWMHGCTIRLAGENFDNQIKQVGVSSYELLIPFQGATVTGTGTGTVYHDALNLANTVTSVRPPVVLQNEMELFPLNGKRDLQGGSLGSVTINAGHQVIRAGYPTLSDRREVNTPVGYFVEQNVQYTGVTTGRLRFYPMPDAAYALRWEQRVTPTVIANFDDTATQLAPHGYDQSIFMPLLRARFAGWVHFEGDKEQLKRDEQIARDILVDLSRKQEHKDVFIAAGGGW